MNKRDWSTDATYYSRTKRPTKCYLTDFGLSRRFADDDNAPRVVVLIIGGGKSAPEFQEDKTTPRDPFPTELYYPRSMIREEFFEFGHVSFRFPIMPRS